MKKQIGYKAGSGSSKKPYTAPDSASSKSIANIVYGISEGEIAGFVNGDQSIILDNTPVQSISGDYNITGVEVDHRLGTNDQTFMPGFPSVVNEIGYSNVELKATSPFVHYVNDLNVNAVRVRFTWGKIFKQNPDNGDVHGYRIEYAVDVQTDGNGFVEVLKTALDDKTSNGYQRQHRIELPPAEVGWEIRVRRITYNAASDFIGDKMYLTAVAEIIDTKLRYPNTAIIGLKFDADKFGSIPKADFRLRGKLIKVPTNYDPEKRTYSTSGLGTTNGVWDGTFKLAYSNNPAWIFYDLVLSRRYGLGDRIDASMLDKWSLYSIAQHCDVMVPDGLGGLEPRLTCNVYLNNKFEAFELLMQLVSTFQGIIHWEGSSIVCTADRPTDPVYTFTRSNIIGEFNYSGTRARDRHSLFSVAFDDPANNYKTDKEVVSSSKAISEVGVRVKELTAFGCTSRGQAQRIGRRALLKEQEETRMVTFAVGLEGYIPITGKIIEIADPLLAGRAIGGRVSVVSSDNLHITVDRDIESSLEGNKRLVINGNDGIQQSRDIVGIDGRVITVSAAFVGVSAEHVWAIDSDDLKLMRFRVLSVSQNRSDSGIISFTVSAVQHNPDTQDSSDNSTYIEPPNYSNIDIYTQETVKNFLIDSENTINQGMDITNVVFSWDQAKGAVKYELEWRRDNGTWIKAPLIYANTYTVENVYHGVYEARIVAINAMDVRSLYVVANPKIINSKFAEPPMLSALSIAGQLFGVVINWSFPAVIAQNALYTKIEISYRADKADAKLLGDFAYPLNRTEVTGLHGNIQVWVRARIIDRNEVEGPWFPWMSAVTEAEAEKILDMLDGQLTENQLNQDLSNKIAIGAEAALAAESAQNAADAAAQAATNAQAAADQVQAQVTTTTTELRGLLDVTADGLTQEILDRQNGDANVVGQLNTYKTSNDAAMSAVQQQAEAASSASSANATALTNLNTEVVAAHNLASNALQQAQSATDATSTNASNLIALSSRMDTAVQAGDNLLVNSNVDKPYNGNYPHGTYALGEFWEVGATYTLLWCASFVRTAPDQNNLVLAAYAGGGMQSLQSIGTDGERQVHKVTFVVRPEGTYANEICFFLLNSNGGYLDAGATVHWAVLVKASDINTKVWVRSKYDVDNAIYAKLDASAINEYYTKVQADQAIAGQITTFESALALALGGGWMDIGREGSQSIVERGVGTIEVIDRTVNHFKITATNDGEFIAYIGACNNSSTIPVGTPYVMTGKIRASRANLYDRIYSRFNQYSSESDVYGWNASSDWVTFKASGVTTTQDQLPVYNIIGAYTPNAIAGDWVEFKDCRISVNSDSVTAAYSQAIRNTETAIATVDGKVAAQATDILNLNSSLTNLNNTKLDAAIIQQYRTAVDQDSVTTSELTQFKSALKIGGDNLFTDTKTFNNEASENSTSSFYPSYGGFGGNTQEFLPNALFGTHTVVKTSSSWCGFYLREADGVSWEAQEDMVLSFWANASADVHVYGIASQLGHAATIQANQPMTKYEVLIPKGKPLRNSSNQGIIEFYFPNGGELWYGAVMLQVGTKSTSWQPSSKDNELDTSQFASATALENLTTNVSNIDGVVSSHTNQINAHQASIDTALDVISIRDTRYNDFPPSHYRQYYALKEVREFKVSGTISLPTSGAYPAYCTLVTRTQWTDASGGNVIQRVEFDDPTLNLYRKSNDGMVNWDTWSAWENKLVGSLSAKADASYVNEINNKVIQAENGLTALSNTVTENAASLVNNINLFRNSGFDATPIDGHHWQGVYWESDDGAQMAVESWGHFNIMRIQAAADGRAFSGIAQVLQFDDYRYSGKKLQFRFLTSSVITRTMRLGVHYLNGAGDIFYQEWVIFTHTTGYTNKHSFTLPAVNDARSLRVMITEELSQSAYDWALIQPSFNTGNAPIREYVPSSQDGLYVANAAATVTTQTRAEVQSLNGQVSSLASQTSTLSTTVGNNTAAIQLQQSSIDGINAKATLQVEAGGVVGGVALGNNGGVVDFLVRANNFAIAPPVGAAGANKYAFQYRSTSVTLPNGVVVPAGLYLDNATIDYIDASKIYATSLSAISAVLGTLTTYKNPANPNGARMILEGSLIRIYDDNNVMRVRMGLWS